MQNPRSYYLGYGTQEEPPYYTREAPRSLTRHVQATKLVTKRTSCSHVQLHRRVRAVGRQPAARLEAIERVLNARRRRRLSAIRGECHHVGGLAHDVLDAVAAPRVLDVRRKGPLAHAPVLDIAPAGGVA